MLIVVDLNQHLPTLADDSSIDQHRIARRYSELIRYHLYREYYLDTGTYSLTNRDMSLYCRMKSLLLEELHAIGKLAVAYSKRRSVVRIKNRDAYVVLFGELSDARES
jgi:hypothetical protein